jgi:hypothetical protein
VSRARRRTVHALFARVGLAVAVLFVRIVHALLSCCRASFVRVARAIRTRRHTLFACVACATYSCRSPCRALSARCRVLFRARHRVSFVSVERAVRTRCHAPFACVARLATRCSRVSRVSIAWVARRLHMIINSLPLINTHVSDVNSSSHIC